MNTTDKPSELLNCPFCGGSKLYGTSNGIGSSYIECEDCGACGPNSDGEEADGELWNRRPQSSEQAGDWPELPALPDCISRLKFNDAPLFDAFQMHQYATAYGAACRQSAPAKPCDADGGDVRLLQELAQIIRENKPVGAWPNEKTADAIDSVIRRLAQPQPSDDDRAEIYRQGWLAGNKNGEAAMGEAMRVQPQRQGRVVLQVSQTGSEWVDTHQAGYDLAEHRGWQRRILYAEQPARQGHATVRAKPPSRPI